MTKKVLKKFSARVNEFHVAPQVSPKNGLPFHEWFIEFDKQPADLCAFTKELDVNLQDLNYYYKDLINGSVLKPLEITLIKKGGFVQYMKCEGKLGGQNKVPRLANDRKVANQLRGFV